MKNARLITATLLLILTASIALAEPPSTVNCCKPEPVGGMQTLVNNTEFPLWAREDHLSGDVLVSITVETDGTVSDISVVRSAGAIFDASVKEAIMSTSWVPAQQNGHPVRVTYQLPFEFKAG